MTRDYKVEEIIINHKRNDYGFFVTVGMVNDYVLTVRSDYRPTKSQAAAMLIDKMRRQDESFRREMVQLVKG